MAYHNPGEAVPRPRGFDRIAAHEARGDEAAAKLSPAAVVSTTGASTGLALIG